MPGKPPTGGGGIVDGAAKAAGGVADGAKDVASWVSGGVGDGLDVAGRLVGGFVRGLVPPEAADALPFVLGWLL